MKNLQNALVSIGMVGLVVAVFAVNCDAEAQARQVNTIARTVTRAVSAAVVTAPVVTHATVEASELEWFVTGEALARTPDGCSEWRARRPEERTWYRVRICGDGTTTSLARIR